MQFLSFRGPGEIKLRPEKFDKDSLNNFPGQINDFNFSLVGTHVHQLWADYTSEYTRRDVYVIAYRLSERKRSESRKSAKLIPWLMSMSHKVEYIVIYKIVWNKLKNINLPHNFNLLEQISPICSDEAVQHLLLAPVSTKLFESPFSSVMTSEILSKIDNIKVEPCPRTGVALISIKSTDIQFESTPDDPRVLNLVRECPAAKEAYDSIFGVNQDDQLIDYD